MKLRFHGSLGAILPVRSFNLVNFYHNESRLLGVDSLKLSFEETAEILRRLTAGFESGIFPAPHVEIFSLEEGPRLYRDIAESKFKGKPILVHQVRGSLSDQV